MAKLGERPTVKHIMEFLRENKGFAVRFSYIYKEFRKKGYKHNSTSISTNLRDLVDQKKIVNIKPNLHLSLYGIPKKRPDGTIYIVAKKVYEENEIVEL